MGSPGEQRPRESFPRESLELVEDFFLFLPPTPKPRIRKHISMGNDHYDRPLNVINDKNRWNVAFSQSWINCHVGTNLSDYRSFVASYAILFE